jgi:hypothetical protein
MVIRTWSPLANPCPFGTSILNQRALWLAWVSSWDIRQSFSSSTWATNSIRETNSTRGTRDYAPFGVTIQVVLLE